MARGPLMFEAQVRRQLIEEELEKLREVPHSLWRDVVGQPKRCGELTLSCSRWRL